MVSNHPARRITVDELGELFCTAYYKAATIENTVAGFRTSGIYPFNSDVLPSSDYFEDSRVSAQVLVTATPAVEVTTASDESVSIPAESFTPLPEGVSSNNTSETATKNQPNNESSSSSVGCLTTQSASTEINVDLQTISSASTDVSFNDILPVPKIEAKQSKRKGGHSEILTSSLYKNALVETYLSR